MKRGLDLDVLAAIEDPEAIPRMLESMALPSTEPARAASLPLPQQRFGFDQ